MQRHQLISGLLRDDDCEILAYQFIRLIAVKRAIGVVDEDEFPLLIRDTDPERAAFNQREHIAGGNDPVVNLVALHADNILFIAPPREDNGQPSEKDEAS
ncbi:hypothetical protein WYI_20059 [Ochrobactrum sp. CDB2]|nr:hypothetical protein WYI_20059 [Ochrobactrum sp. CDB2]